MAHKSGASNGAKKINAFNDGKLEGVNVAGDYTIEDKKNVINFHKSGRKTPKPYELESLRRQYKA